MCGALLLSPDLLHAILDKTMSGWVRRTVLPALLLGMMTGFLVLQHVTALMDSIPQTTWIDAGRSLDHIAPEQLLTGDGRWQQAGRSLLSHVMSLNVLTFLVFLTTVAGPIIWILLGYMESSQRRELLKRSKVTQLLLMVFVLLLVVNYVLNTYQRSQEVHQLMELLRERLSDVPRMR